jgi:SAM-dependent methyltransferase
MNRDLAQRVYPEIAFGGYSRVDGTVSFYSRVQALLSPEATILDIGCGRGLQAEDPCTLRRALCDLRAPQRRVLGIDVDPEGAANPLVDEFRQIADTNHWPVETASIDLAIANSVVEHVAEPEKFFAEAWRVLRPGGYLCFRTYNKWAYVGVCARLVPNRLHAKVTARVQTERHEHDVFPTLYRCNTRRAVRRALGRQGFESIVLMHEAEPSYLQFSPLIYRVAAVLHRLFPPFMRWMIFAYARKPGGAASA